MIYLLQILLLAWLLCLVPLFCGLMLGRISGKMFNRIEETMVYGYMAMFTLFLPLAAVSVKMSASLTFLGRIWIMLAFAVSVLSLLLNHRELVSECRGWWERYLNGSRFYRMIPVMVLLLTIGALFFIMPDSSGEIIENVTWAVHTDTLYQYDPGTGSIREAIPNALVFSPLDLYYAVLCKFTGVHPMILVQAVLPIMLIPLYYMEYALWGAFLFAEDNGKEAVFLGMTTLVFLYPLFVERGSGLRIFAGAWQRETLICSLIIPAAIMLFLQYAKQRIGKWQMLLLLLCIAGAAELVFYKGVYFIGLIAIAFIAMEFFGRWQKCRTS